MSTVTLQNLIRNNWSVRQEFEGPTGLEGRGPVGGWQAIVDRHYDNELLRQGLVLRPDEKVCPRCHMVKTITNVCVCDE